MAWLAPTYRESCQPDDWHTDLPQAFRHPVSNVPYVHTVCNLHRKTERCHQQFPVRHVMCVHTV
jgi:hypothetical protein